LLFNVVFATHDFLGYLFAFALAAIFVKHSTWAVFSPAVRGHSPQAEALQALQPETP
jgi:hypothetical protein